MGEKVRDLDLHSVVWVGYRSRGGHDLHQVYVASAPVVLGGCLQEVAGAPVAQCLPIYTTLYQALVSVWYRLCYAAPPPRHTS